MTNLSNHFLEQRHRQGLSLGKLARLIGYTNVNKGSRHIQAFEREGRIRSKLLGKLIVALHIDPAVARSLIEKDDQEHQEAWERWVNEPVPMVLVVRWMAAVYGQKAIPPEITTQAEAEVYASRFAKENGQRVCLVVSRKVSVYFGADGEIETRSVARPHGGFNFPHSKIKGREFLFGFSKQS